MATPSPSPAVSFLPRWPWVLGSVTILRSSTCLRSRELLAGVQGMLLSKVVKVREIPLESGGRDAWVKTAARKKSHGVSPSAGWESLSPIDGLGTMCVNGF